MLALMEALKENSETLKEVFVHDNWIKQEAVHKVVELLFRARNLEKLNISDSDMGNDSVLLVIRALKESPVA